MTFNDGKNKDTEQLPELTFSRIELLFFEQREGNITFEEFQAAGWSKEEFLEYLKLCEELRCACVVIQTLHEPKSKNEASVFGKNRNVEGIKHGLFINADRNLKDFLNRYVNHTPISAFLGWDSFLSVKNIPSILPKREEKYLPYIYLSADEFRGNIEYYIYNILRGSWAERVIEEYSEEELSDLKRESQEELSETSDVFEEIDVNTCFDSYSSLQQWAEIYVKSRDTLSDNEILIDMIDDEMEERKKRAEESPFFSLNKDILYIYKGSCKCLAKEHEVTCMTAEIPDINDNVVRVNVHYCQNCKRFFIYYSEYQVYSHRYLLAKFVLIESEKKSGSDTGHFNSQSLLFQCGYNVSMNGPSEEIRRNILVKLIQHEIISKSVVLKHLNNLIDMNEDNKKMKDARLKWSDDRLYMLEYDFENQETIALNSVESATKTVKMG